MASKINPKGIKSNSRYKGGPNPKGINPGGINNKPAPKPKPKPAPKPVVSSTKLKPTDPKTMGQVVKGEGYKAPVRPTTTASKPAPKPAAKKPVKPVASKPVTTTTTTTTPRTRGGVSKGNTPGTSGKYAKKTPLEKKPLVDTKPRTRGGASKGETPGVGSKRKALADIKARANERLAAEKAAAEKSVAEKAAAEKAPKANLKRTRRMSGVERRRLAGKPPAERSKTLRNVKIAEKAKALKNAKLAKAGKVGGVILGAAAATYGIKKLYDYSKSKEDKAKKDTKKPEAKKDETKPKVGGNKTGIKTDTLIKTPSLKDELKKKGVDYKPAKDKWGRGVSSKWYGFNPATKNYESPVTSNKKDERTGSLGKDIIKAGEKANASRKTKAEDNFKELTPKKKETKPLVKKPATPAISKADNKVDKMEMKPTTQIANTIEAKKEIIQPKAAATSTASTSSSTSSSKPSSSTPASGAQPRATFGNKVRGMLNESRERRAGRAASRGNEERSERLKEKISDTEKKMMMKKGGIVKRNKKK